MRWPDSNSPLFSHGGHASGWGTGSEANGIALNLNGYDAANTVQEAHYNVALGSLTYRLHGEPGTSPYSARDWDSTTARSHRA